MRHFMLKMVLNIIIAGFLFMPLSIQGQCEFLIDQNIRDIYKKIIELKLDSAQVMIDEGLSENNSNLMYYFMEDYIDFFRVFINEDIEEFKYLEENKEKRIELISNGASSDPYYNMVLAEIHIHWAMCRLKFEEYYTALIEIRKAYLLLIKNREMFPDFSGTNKALAIIHAVIGTIPDNYKYLITILTGMEGSIPQALNEIEELRKITEKSDFLFREEVFVIQSLILLHFANEKEKAWQVIDRAGLDVKNSLAAVFIKSNIARHTGRTDLAIKILEQRPKGDEFAEFNYLDLMLGNNKLHRLDADAHIYLLKYVENFQGRNYIKEAYQKLAWHSWIIENNREKALEYYNKCLRNGAQLMDEDESAYEDALQNELPEKTLIKSRLLFDGGYYERSLEELRENKAILSQNHSLVYHYTLARNYQNMLKFNSAFYHFRYILERKEFDNSYQKCNAALQSAIMYEELKDEKSAKHYFNLSLSMNPNKYQKSLHQKAKAGLNRLNMN